MSNIDVDMYSLCIGLSSLPRGMCAIQATSDPRGPAPMGLMIGLVHGMCRPTNRSTPCCGRSKIDEDQDFQKQNEDTETIT